MIPKRLYDIYNQKGTYLYSKMLNRMDAQHLAVHEDLICKMVEKEGF